MIKSIFLFCNKKYGSSFFRTFVKFARENPDADCTVVFSTKGRKKNITKDFLRTLWLLIKKDEFINWDYKITHKTLTVIECYNVNSPKFIGNIPKNTVGFIAGFNQIFSANFIGRFDILINFHPSLLPYYRGAIPSYWVLRNNEAFSGFTAHVVTEKVDLGEIIFQDMLKIEKEMSESELDFQIAQLGSVYFKECLDAVKMQKPFARKKIESPYKNKIGHVPSSRVPDN